MPATHSSAVPRLTVDLLRAYGQAALDNASALHAEAALLLEHKRFSRAYFLGVAAVEETGKAAQAFDAQGRNLDDADVRLRIVEDLRSHKSKITSAFIPWLLGGNQTEAAVRTAVELIGHLRRGREPAMYTDISGDPLEVRLPSVLVREVAAKDCVRLAGDCLANARHFISSRNPTKRTSAEDRFFSMKPQERKKLMNAEDFWWFYIAEMEKGRQDFAAAAVEYRDSFLATSKRFRA
jgi:AbiV family abortive infection protein